MIVAAVAVARLAIIAVSMRYLYCIVGKERAIRTKAKGLLLLSQSGTRARVLAVVWAGELRSHATVVLIPPSLPLSPSTRSVEGLRGSDGL